MPVALLLAFACHPPPEAASADTGEVELMPLLPAGAPTILDIAIQDDLGPSTDLDGDGRADACARADAGLRCQLSDGTAFPTLATSVLFGDPAGFSDGANYRTLRFGDISGDGRADVCARADSGMQCHLSTGTGWSSTVILGPAWSDAAGWSALARYGSIRMVDYDDDGRQDLCGLDGTNMWCARSLGVAFAAAQPGAFMDWVDPSSTMEWGSLSWGDIDHNRLPDFCLINDNVSQPGLVCWLQTSASTWSTDIQTGGDWTPANGWNNADKWSTVRFDIVGDERGDRLIGRGAAGIEAAYWSAGPQELVTQLEFAQLTDAQGYTDPANYATLRVGDITGDGLGDLCIRADAGMRCHPRVSGGTFSTTAIVGPAWSDANGWTTEDKYLTIRLADFDGDGKQDLCGRGADGYRCARSTGAAFAAETTRVAWTDAGGWNQEDNFIPMHAAGTLPDTNGDLVPDALDGCPFDSTKTAPGVCGCGVSDADTDGDGTPDCLDLCPADPAKTDPGLCGCGAAEDADADGFSDCLPCGDGALGAGEDCDDGAHVAGDGCSPTCALEPLSIVSFAPGLAGVRNTITVGGAHPGATIRLVVSTQSGTTPLPGCPGVTVPLRAPTLLGARTATDDARALFDITPPATASGLNARLVAVDLARCTQTPVWIELL